MKKIILPLLIVFLFSCSQPNITPNSTNGDPEISFDVNGTHYAYIGPARDPNNDPGVYAYKDYDATNSRFYYEFYGFKDLDNYIAILIFKDSLTTGPYSDFPRVGIRLAINNKSYTSFGGATVTISQYNSGIVNGTFTANCTNDGGPSLPGITITNGAIKNVKMHYW